jgi:hypothetical protein
MKTNKTLIFTFLLTLFAFGAFQFATYLSRFMVLGDTIALTAQPTPRIPTISKPTLKPLPTPQSLNLTTMVPVCKALVSLENTFCPASPPVTTVPTNKPINCSVGNYTPFQCPGTTMYSGATYSCSSDAITAQVIQTFGYKTTDPALCLYTYATLKSLIASRCCPAYSPPPITPTPKISTNLPICDDLKTLEKKYCPTTMTPFSGVIIKGNSNTIVSVTTKNSSDSMSPCLEIAGTTIVCNGTAITGTSIGQCAQGSTGYAIFNKASCPTQTATPTSTSACFYNNQTFQFGETYRPDSCNVCFCSSNSKMVCATPVSCSKPTPKIVY